MREETGETGESNLDTDGIEEETKENAAENRILEEFISSNHNNASKISAEYKLFDIVSSKNPSQILRYSQQQTLVRHPLWVGDRHKPAEVPPCAKCGSQRIFEFQLMPQFLNYQEMLRLVDWETIIVYTCTSTRCMPDLASDEGLVEEFAFIQFSEDFDQVQFGTQEEIDQRR